MFSAYALTDNTLIITIRRVSYLIGKLPKENDNYIKFADGTLIQWGRVNSPGSEPGTGTVIFPMAFADTNYVLEATPEYGGSAYPVFEVSCQRIDASKAVFYFKQNGNTSAIITGVYAFWLAIGKWK